MIYGVDVSNWQPEYFPLELSDGTPIDFAIIQVTRGMDGVNDKWRAQAAWARENGLAVGFYHFGKVADSPDAQARRFSRELTAHSTDTLYPGETLWYDWEGSELTAPTNAQKDQFIQELKRLRPGRKVGLYCNVDFWKNRDTTDYCGDALWIASWSDPAVEPPIQAPWTIHQYSDGGGKLDHDRAKFTDREAMKVWGGASKDPVTVRLEILFNELLHQAQLATERYDTLKAALDRLEVSVGDLVAGDTDHLAEQVVDEIRRRLES